MPALNFPRTVNDLANYEFDKPKKIGKKFEQRAYDVYEWIYIRSRLSEAQNHRCCWCQEMTTEDRNKKKSSTVEHYECKSLGGTDDVDNLVMACYECNQKRGTFSPDVFLDHILYGRELPGQRNHRKMYQIASSGNKKKLHTILQKLRYNSKVVWC